MKLNSVKEKSNYYGMFVPKPDWKSHDRMHSRFDAQVDLGIVQLRKLTWALCESAFDNVVRQLIWVERELTWAFIRVTLAVTVIGYSDFRWDLFHIR